MFQSFNVAIRCSNTKYNILRPFCGLRRVWPLTFGRVQLVPCALTPAGGVDVGGVGVYPEVVAVGVAVEVEPQPVAAHLDRGVRE